MKTRKKLIISIATLSVAIVAALGITFGVLAAQNQAVVNQFTVSYTASNVVATVSASYLKAGDQEANRVNFTDGNSNTTISFSAANDKTTGSLSVSDFTLSADADYVIFRYAFQNDASVGGRAMSVTLTDTSVKTNVTCYYYAVADNANVSYETIVAANNDDASDLSALTVSAKTAGEQTNDPDVTHIGYFYVVVKITDNTLNASYTSGAQNGISWALASVS